MSTPLHGNVSGLRPSERKDLERIYRRRVPPDEVASFDLLSEMCEISRTLRRQVGVLIDRRGNVEQVIVGDNRRVVLGDVGRQRAGRGRLRGLRLVHTHLRPDPLDRDDLADLVRLSLDLVACVESTASGEPGEVGVAHLAFGEDGVEPRLLAPVAARGLSLRFDELVSEVETELAHGAATAPVSRPRREGALIIDIEEPGAGDHGDNVREIRELMDTAGVPVLDVITQRRSEADPRHVVGKGKLEEILTHGMRLGCNLVVFGRNLAPSQARAIADMTEMKVIDRTQLILDIFASRARSKGGKLQVELAQLRYSLPRLAHRHTALSRLAGGIGGRGPGESKLEMDRRKARTRIHLLEQQLDALSKDRELSRRLRKRHDVHVVSLVGYTNAGKSTLLNTLTRSSVLAENKLFATLDPTSRRLFLPGLGDVVITDTVGFIRDFPPDLVAAFKATLEELEDASLLIHVVDAADHRAPGHVEAVEAILSELGLAGLPRILALNKMDLAGDSPVAASLLQGRRGVRISARSRAGLDPLLSLVREELLRLGPCVGRLSAVPQGTSFRP